MLVSQVATGLARQATRVDAAPRRERRSERGKNAAAAPGRNHH